MIFVDTRAGDLSKAARAPPLVSSGGSAVLRRERRLRSFWRHEQMAIHMALATVTHHSFQVGTAHDALRSQKPVTGAGGMRPPPLVEGRPQERIQQYTVELMIDVSPYVQILDAPVPQVEDHALEFFRRMDLQVAEQVIVVPRISCSPCPSRSPFPEPQSAEQLVEVPTVLSPTRIALQIAEQIVDTPVPRGRGKRRVQGFLPRQSSSATPSAEERISGLWSSSYSLLLRNALLSGLRRARRHFSWCGPWTGVFLLCWSCR